MTPLPRRYWLTAISLAVLLHLAAATVLLWRPASSIKGTAVQAGVGGIEISLGPAGGTPGGAQKVEAEENPVEETPEQEVTEPHTETPEAQEPEPMVESEPVVEPEPIEKTEPIIKPETIPEKKAPSKKHSKDKPHKKRKPSVQGSSGKSGNKDQQDSGSGDNAAGGGLAGDTSDYMASLQAWLERHKQYPRMARRLRQEGTALLYFVINPDGEVINYELRQSSGHQYLDEEVLAMIERAQPLPKMPEQMEQKQMELVIPVEFFLR